jgi:hypothetical protein
MYHGTSSKWPNCYGDRYDKCPRSFVDRSPFVAISKVACL